MKNYKEKEKEIVIDGYVMFVYYQKTDHSKHSVETLQIFGRTSPFLPFNVVSRLARRILGQDELSLVEIFKNDRKVYVWSVCKDKKGIAIASPYEAETEECEFEGWTYFYMQPNQVDFF